MQIRRRGNGVRCTASMGLAFPYPHSTLPPACRTRGGLWPEVMDILEAAVCGVEDAAPGHFVRASIRPWGAPPHGPATVPRAPSGGCEDSVQPRDFENAAHHLVGMRDKHATALRRHRLLCPQQHAQAR